MKQFLVVISLVLAACGNVSGTPEAPMLKSVEKMDGALMVRWMNMESGCTAVEGERMMGSESFKQVFSVPGEVDNKHDTSATTDAMHMYRVRCVKGGASSAWSGEMGMNPVR